MALWQLWLIVLTLLLTGARIAETLLKLPRLLRELVQRREMRKTQKLRAEHDAEMQKLRADHDEEMQKLDAKHEVEMQHLSTDYEAKIQKLRAEHAEERTLADTLIRHLAEKITGLENELKHRDDAASSQSEQGRKRKAAKTALGVAARIAASLVLAVVGIPPVFKHAAIMTILPPGI
jgi:hypothetical protein